MESTLVKAALSVVGTALSPFKDSLLEKWAATNELGSNVKDLELELLAVQALLEHTVGKEIVDNSALKRLLVTLQDLGYDAEDVLDELEYFRIQDELDGTFEAADEHGMGCACDQGLHVCHAANAVGKQIASWFTCFCAAAPAGFKARLHDHVGKHSTCLCLPCVRDGPRKLKFHRVDASTRMKNIVEKLQLVRGIVSSTFTALGSDNLITVPDIAQSRPITTSESTDPKFYGRDDISNRIIHDITEGKHSREALTVIPIFGLGGIGKTTLAQHIYKKVQQHFEVKVWTCVSLNFNVNRLIEEIKEGIPKVNDESGTPSKENDESGTPSELIAQRLKMKRFLLVLDDMWDCRNEDEWKQLLAPFRKSQVLGNIIMVTTRFRAQAQMMIQKDDHSIYLEGLENNEFKKLYLDIVFGNDKSRHEVDKSLLEIGDKIADKLKGSPLAAKTVGRLLRTQVDLDHWTKVLKNKEWMETKDANDIMPALKLSYYYLPAQLQRCFSYCSLFPQDYKFEREELINFWIGLDVLHSSHGENKRVEDVGQSHLTELVNYGFSEKEGEKDGSTCYIIHDLLHELAQKHECLSIEISSQSQVSSLQIPPSIRHLSINTDDTSVKDRLTFNNCVENLNTLDKRLKIEKLRSLVLFGKHHGCFVKAFGDLFKEAKALRVVFLSKASYDLKDLLCNFHYLVHLRYLRIESSSLVQTKFPNTLSRLYHMIVLDTKHCDIDLLPRDMSNNRKLRHFLVQKDSTHSGIPEVGKIKSLQELRSFVVRKEGQGFGLKQIGHLVELSGSLCIYNLENVRAMEEADEAKLMQKDSLHELILHWNSSRSTIDPALQENVLERLRPSSNIQKLSIIQHGGAICPSWLGMNLSVKSLECLCLSGVAWETFPPIGDLWLGNHMTHEDISVKISNKRFEKLRWLELRNLPMLKKWTVDAPCQLFPLLEGLVISGCSELVQLSLSHYACCQQENLFPRLSELRIEDCPQLSSIPAVPWTKAPCSIVIKGTKIETLKMLICENDSDSKYRLEIQANNTRDSMIWNVLDFRNLTKLTKLRIHDCQPLPLHHLQLLSSLRSLTMSCSSNALPSLEGNSVVKYQFPVQRLNIEQCYDSGKELTQLLTYFPEVSDLELCNYKEVNEKITGLCVAGQEATATHRPSSSVNKVDKAQIEIVAPAAEGLVILPSQLQRLELYKFPEISLCSYPLNDNSKEDRPTGEGGGLQGLNSLEELEIYYCPKLLSSYSKSPPFPGFPFPNSLKCLEIDASIKPQGWRHACAARRRAPPRPRTPRRAGACSRARPWSPPSAPPRPPPGPWPRAVSGAHGPGTPPSWPGCTSRSATASLRSSFSRTRRVPAATPSTSACRAPVDAASSSPRSSTQCQDDSASCSSAAALDRMALKSAARPWSMSSAPSSTSSLSAMIICLLVVSVEALRRRDLRRRPAAAEPGYASVHVKVAAVSRSVAATGCCWPTPHAARDKELVAAASGEELVSRWRWPTSWPGFV